MYSTQNASYLIYRLYMACRYPGAARQSRSPQRPLPSPNYHSIPVLLGGAGTATPGSSPLSMRLGILSGWVGKHKRLQAARKSAACPKPLDEELIDWNSYCILRRVARCKVLDEKEKKQERKVRLHLTLKNTPCPGSPMSVTSVLLLPPPQHAGDKMDGNEGGPDLTKN